MNIFRQNRSVRSFMNAAGLGVALTVLLSLILFAGAMIELWAPSQSRDSIGTSAIVSAATAAVPANEMLAATPPLVVGDSGLDEFRLDRDSCCINHY